MTKKSYALKSICVLLLGLFFSCKENEIIINTNEDSIELRNVSFDDDKSDLKDELIFYSMTENYKLSDDAIYNDLISFLSVQTQDKDIEKKDIDITRSIKIEKNKFAIKKVKSFKKELPNYNYSLRNINSVDDVTFSIYNFENFDDKTRGLAVTSDDERIGSLLCVLNDINYNDITKDPVFEIFLTKLDDYIDEVCNELELITENDIDIFKEKYNITDEEIARAKLEYEHSLEARKFWGADSWSSWSICNINLNNLISKTKWNQGYPYNLAIEAMENKPFYMYTGCGATAVAQIMAYHKWPKSYTQDNLDLLKEKWSLASDWDGVYYWDEMTEKSNIRELSELGEICVAALMYDVSKGINSEYEINGTSSNFNNTIKYLDKIKFNHDKIQNYSYDVITKSLNSNCPVLIRGDDGKEGHAWIIDGSLKLIRTRNYYVFWIPFKNTEYQEYVHCNYGWSGTDDEGSAYSYNGIGYYKSGVFSKNLNNSINIIPNIKPNN